MARILIAGAPGCGKTTLAHAMAGAGHYAIDVDEVIAGRVHPATRQPVTLPSPIPEGWRGRYPWDWDREKLKRVFADAADRDIFVCGNGDSQEEFYDEFDKIIFLHVPDEVIVKRLSKRTISNFGYYPDERDRAVGWNQLAGTVGRKNHTVIESDRPVKEVMDDILALAAS